MTPAKEVLITTLQGIETSICNMLCNLRDTNGHVNDDGEVFEDFKDLEESQEQLTKLIKELKR